MTTYFLHINLETTLDNTYCVIQAVVRSLWRHTTICYYMELQGGSTNLIILEAKGRCTAAAASQDFQSWAASSSTQRIELL